MLPLCLQLNELTLLLAIFFAFAALPACSRQAKPEIKIEQLTPEQQARAKANCEIADAKRQGLALFSFWVRPSGPISLQ